MTKLEALEYLQLSPLNRVKHSYYSGDEWLSFKDGKFVTEDGYSHGGIYDEFWNTYQIWEDGWEKIETGNPEESVEDFSGTELPRPMNTFKVSHNHPSNEIYEYDVKIHNTENYANPSPIYLSKRSHKRTNKRK